MCCKRSFLPLELAFARTLHRFQGLSAGPVDSGKLPNMFGVIICDPDSKAVEGRATGFFYTMLTRATTLGDPDGRNSAIYFIGPHLTKERIQDITLKTNSNQTLVNVHRRSIWVAKLEQNIISAVDASHMQSIFEWASGRVSYDELFFRTRAYIAASKKLQLPTSKKVNRKTSQPNNT